MAPMMLDLKEAGQITINVILNEQTISTAIIDSLEKPEVIQTIRAKI